MGMEIRTLGIVGSPREGNSLFLMQEALQSLRDYSGSLPVETSIELMDLKGKKISPCLACGGCAKKRRCLIEDDFAPLFDSWVQADLVLYSVPVYHLGVPAQFKAFLDRLGNTLRPYYNYHTLRHLKVMGSLVQGRHPYSGQELTLAFLQQHAVLMTSLPVAGDRWQSYLGAMGWTGNSGDRDALAELEASGNEDATIMLKSARDVAVRCLEMAYILKTGLAAVRDDLEKDETYRPALSRLAAKDGAQ